MQYLPKLTLRDLLWLVIVISMALAWRGDQLRFNASLKECRDREAAAIQAQGEAEALVRDYMLGLIANHGR